MQGIEAAPIAVGKLQRPGIVSAHVRLEVRTSCHAEAEQRGRPTLSSCRPCQEACTPPDRHGDANLCGWSRRQRRRGWHDLQQPTHLRDEPADLECTCSPEYEDVSGDGRECVAKCAVANCARMPTVASSTAMQCVAARSGPSVTARLANSSPTVHRSAARRSLSVSRPPATSLGFGR